MEQQAIKALKAIRSSRWPKKRSYFSHRNICTLKRLGHCSDNEKRLSIWKQSKQTVRRHAHESHQENARAFGLVCQIPGHTSSATAEEPVFSLSAKRKQKGLREKNIGGYMACKKKLRLNMFTVSNIIDCYNDSDACSDLRSADAVQMQKKKKYSA